MIEELVMIVILIESQINILFDTMPKVNIFETTYIYHCKNQNIYFESGEIFHNKRLEFIYN